MELRNNCALRRTALCRLIPKFKKDIQMNKKIKADSDSSAGGTKPIVSGSEFETMERWCQNCKQITTQYVKLYNPDNAEDGEVWECHNCGENTAWAS